MLVLLIRWGLDLNLLLLFFVLLFFYFFVWVAMSHFDWSVTSQKKKKSEEAL
jgi:hypothetical protein